MNELENIIFDTILVNYYKKHNKIPTYGHYLVAYNVVKTGDMLDYMLDYMLDIKKEDIYLHYNYYENSKKENKYISSSVKICEG